MSAVPGIYTEPCPRRTLYRASCKAWDCPVCGPKRHRDAYTCIAAALASYGGDVVMLTVTAPGAPRLPWDEHHCAGRHKYGGRHEGKRGCRVQQREAREWNETARHRFGLLRQAGRKHVQRHLRDAAGQPLPFSYLELAWEMQRRGVGHTHVVLGVKTEAELRTAATFVRYVKEHAADYDFGFADARGKREKRDPRSRGRRVTVDGVELRVISGADAARYIASYLAGRSHRKASLRQNAIDPAANALRGRGAVAAPRPRRLRIPMWWVKPGIGGAEHVTMRYLRRARHLWAWKHGDCQVLPEWKSANEAVRSAIVYRRVFTRRQGGADDDSDALLALAAELDDEVAAIEASEEPYMYEEIPGGLFIEPVRWSSWYRSQLHELVERVVTPVQGIAPAPAAVDGRIVARG